MTSVLPLLASFALVCSAADVSASTEVIQGYAYRGDAYDIINPVPRYDRGPTPTNNLTAGAATVSDLLITEQATNASVGKALGFCVALRDGGPSQCQITIQLASGTVQVDLLDFAFCLYRCCSRIYPLPDMFWTESCVGQHTSLCMHA